MARPNAVDIAPWQVAVITPDGVARSTRCELFGLPSSISRQLPRSSMLLFARRVKHAPDVAVQRPHDADTHVHQEVAVFCGAVLRGGRNIGAGELLTVSLGHSGFAS